MKKTQIEEKTKIKLFEKMYELEELEDKATFDGHDYNEQSEGAFQMLAILGLDHEYIKWSLKKDYPEIMHMKW